MMIEPNKALLSEDGVVTAIYSGKTWPIPKLAMAQLVILSPLLPKVMEGIRNAGGFFSVELLQDLATVCFHGLQRGHEGLTREEFDLMGTDTKEMSFFALAVAAQTNGYRPAKDGEKSAPLANGVAAAATPAPPIGAH